VTPCQTRIAITSKVAKAKVTIAPVDQGLREALVADGEMEE